MEVWQCRTWFSIPWLPSMYLCLSGVNMKTILLIVVEIFAFKLKSFWFFPSHKVKSLKEFFRPVYKIYRKFYLKCYWKFYHFHFWSCFLQCKIFVKFSVKYPVNIVNWRKTFLFIKGFYLVSGKKLETFWVGSKFFNNY